MVWNEDCAALLGNILTPVNVDSINGMREQPREEFDRRLRDQQAANIGIVAKAFDWSEADARDELSRVHLANLPENRAFFSGTIDYTAPKDRP